MPACTPVGSQTFTDTQIFNIFAVLWISCPTTATNPPKSPSGVDPFGARHYPCDELNQEEPMGSLANKTLFITGASRGIGKAIALRAARDGANVAIAAKTAEPHPKLDGTI